MSDSEFYLSVQQALIKQGIKEGARKGIEKAVRQGIRQGAEAGVRKGIQIGVSQGLVKMRSLIVMQLGRKIGELNKDAIATINQLSWEELERLGTELLEFEKANDLTQWLSS